MNPTFASTTSRRSTTTTHRWIRQIHLWIGAWGAIAAIVYGFTGLVMNHRFGDGAWPQGESVESNRIALDVPTQARATPEALSLWLRASQGLDATSIRKGGRGGRGDPSQPEKWNLSGGTAGASWSLEYAPGQPQAEIKHSKQTPLAAFNRLHKGVGGGAVWIVLADSFAIGMLLLGLSGIWMWARGRTPRQMIVSVLSASTVVMLLILGASVF